MKMIESKASQYFSFIKYMCGKLEITSAWNTKEHQQKIP